MLKLTIHLLDSRNELLYNLVIQSNCTTRYQDIASKQDIIEASLSHLISLLSKICK